MKTQERMKAVSLKQDIEGIDMRIQSMVDDRAFAGPVTEQTLNDRINQLIQEKRELQRKLHSLENRKFESVESKYLFRGEDISQHRKHTRAMYLKAMERVSDDLGRLETKVRTERTMMGQDMRVRFHELKSMKEQLSLIIQRMSKVNTDKLGDMQVDFQHILSQFEEKFEEMDRELS